MVFTRPKSTRGVVRAKAEGRREANLKRRQAAEASKRTSQLKSTHVSERKRQEKLLKGREAARAKRAAEKSDPVK